jgi:prepilin-type N-terminal cleavage/methylation domain-containing protein
MNSLNAQDLKLACPTRHVEKGFSLIEMMISVAILVVVMGAVLSLMNAQQKSTQNQQLKADMYQSLRGASELMTQEVGQAGLVSVPSPQPTLGAGVVPSPVPQLVAVAPATAVDSMFVGEQLLIDTAGSEESVTLTAVSASTGQITGVFGNAHPAGAIIKVYGTFPNGIMASSTATQLKLLGDINSDGTLVYVEYDCNPNAAGTGTLTRSITPVTPLTIAANASVPLLNNLLTNPGGTPCFAYTTQVAAGNTFVTNVAITLSVQATYLDQQTRQPMTMTKSLLNVAPRNVLIGLELASAAPPVVGRIQPTPPNLATW